ncbi:hypothetical protein Syun_014086 [Stephania yunnanensis]|uniref:Uncharacterized protein n=1 Tax=Stephania yunnanensis TaxID=152371 RepID=A0AAP0PBK0_9MAGN
MEWFLNLTELVNELYDCNWNLVWTNLLNQSAWELQYRVCKVIKVQRKEMNKNEKKQSKNPRKHGWGPWLQMEALWNIKAQCGKERHCVGRKGTVWESQASRENESGVSAQQRCRAVFSDDAILHGDSAEVIGAKKVHIGVGAVAERGLTYMTLGHK